MIIGVAQYKSIKGNIQDNVDHHLEMIHRAADAGADLLIFPELSITGYEPSLAKELAVEIDDPCFELLREACESRQVSVGIGAPIKQGENECIGMIVFRPGQPAALYSKKWLHSDEVEFFVSGSSQDRVDIKGNEIALGICYEISVPEHRKSAMKNGAAFYIASVAKTEEGMRNASTILSDMAYSNGATVMIANAVGYCDNFLAAGRSAIWSADGKLLKELDDMEEAILLFNSKTGDVVVSKKD